jgi:hypothetical protein
MAAISDRRMPVARKVAMIATFRRYMSPEKKSPKTNPGSAAYVAKSEAVGAIGGGGRWKSTDSRRATRPVMPWTGIPVTGDALNSLYWPTLSAESWSPVCTAPKSMKPTGWPVTRTRSHSPN